ALPRTTFSELLRSLDPTTVGPEHDPTHGAFIGPGMWQVLNMETSVDEWGVKRLYVRLLHRMLVLMRALHRSGQVLNVNDYVPLFRAAGAASDLAAAKSLWEQMREHGVDVWRQSDSYDEFIKARLLVDPMYYGYDKARTMMKPRNLHRRSGVFLGASLRRLDRLRFNTRRGALRLGLNKHMEHAEDLARILRKPRPIMRLFYFMRKNGYHINEKILCSIMISFARAGSLRFIQFRILGDYFGIRVTKDRKNPDNIHVAPQPPKTTLPKDKTRPLRPQLRPGERLIRTVIESYCSNGQIAMAFTIVDYISNTFGIPISPHVWSQLLEWTHIMSSKPTSTAWKMAGLQDRVPNTMAIELVWKTMTSAPYNVNPGFDQYSILILSLLNRKSWDDAIEHMNTARAFYDKQCAVYEATAFEYTRALRTAIDPTTSLHAFQRARFHKQHMWFRMRQWCVVFLKKYRPTRLDDFMYRQRIPDFIRDWREFVANPALYRTATGYVQLLDP
ncbi:mitochondrial ATPase expression-domain-containing protein, partial [Xylariales sp. AK1849]